MYVGLIVENALAERVPVGGKNKYETRPRYELEQLLDERFRLPAPEPKGNVFGNFVQQLMAYASDPMSGGRVWQYVGPEVEQEGVA